MGKCRVREHVDTVGSTKSVENRMHGSTSPNPKGGTQSSHPVRKSITSFSVAGPFPSAVVTVKHIHEIST